MFRIFHTNDMHGTLDQLAFERLKELRSHTDLFFDTGDCIKTGNLGVPTKPDPVWSSLTELGISASVLGNRETHPVKSAMEIKVKGAMHPILIANIERAQYPKSIVIEHEGIKIGVLGVMVPMATERMKTAFAWSYRWTSPIPAAVDEAKRIRADVDVVIALTHIGYQQDLKLAEASKDIDIILGGHSHTVLKKPELVNGTYVCQGGSHNRFAGVYEWREGKLTGELVPVRSSNQ